jgi:cytochrome c biogenesis protein CcdA
MTSLTHPPQTFACWSSCMPSFLSLAFLWSLSLAGAVQPLCFQAFGAHKSALGKIGGLIVILFGLSTLGVIKIPFLNYDTRPEWREPSRNGFLASLPMGLFFAAGWTPCVGTTLGAILAMGFNQDTTAQGMILASGYAFGLGLPFLGNGSRHGSGHPVCAPFSPAHAQDPNRQRRVPPPYRLHDAYQSNHLDCHLGPA